MNFDVFPKYNSELCSASVTQERKINILDKKRQLRRYNSSLIVLFFLYK